MAWNWAEKRRFWIIAIAGAFIVLALAGITAAVLYDAPTCTDLVQNSDEEGVDCGGSCQYLCREAVTPARMVFARPVMNAPGRIDVIAYIENRNQSAEAVRAPYTVELYDAGNLLLAKRAGTIDLPPRSVVPLFVPNLYIGTDTAIRAFVSFDADVRFERPAGDRVTPVVVSAERTEANGLQRVIAVLENPSATSVYQVKVIATLFGADGNAMAASQTVLREIPARGTSEAVFTWSQPFPETPVRIEVLPVP